MAKGRSPMSAKRITGPTANATMNLNLRLTKCDYRDSEGKRCEEWPVIVRNLPGAKYKRFCMEHVPFVSVQTRTVEEFARKLLYGN